MRGMSPAKKRALHKRETRGEKLFRTLKELDVSKMDFAKRVERSYVTVYRWFKDEDFGPEQQTLAAAALGLPPDYFDTDNAVERRARAARKAYRDFVQTRPELVAALSQEALGWLRTFRFLDPSIPPSAAFFEAMASAILGAIRPQDVLSVAAENAELDRKLAEIDRTHADKRTPKRR